MELNFFQCEIGFLTIWNWISSNVKLDFFQHGIGFLPIIIWISSHVKLDFFPCEIGFLPIWKIKFLQCKVLFFHCDIGFLPNPTVWCRLGWIMDEFLNYGRTSELWVNFWIMGKLLNYRWTFESSVNCWWIHHPFLKALLYYCTDITLYYELGTVQYQHHHSPGALVVDGAHLLGVSRPNTWTGVGHTTLYCLCSNWY